MVVNKVEKRIDHPLPVVGGTKATLPWSASVSTIQMVQIRMIELDRDRRITVQPSLKPENQIHVERAGEGCGSYSRSMLIMGFSEWSAVEFGRQADPSTRPHSVVCFHLIVGVIGLHCEQNLSQLTLGCVQRDINSRIYLRPLRVKGRV